MFSEFRKISSLFVFLMIMIISVGCSSKYGNRKATALEELMTEIKIESPQFSSSEDKDEEEIKKKKAKSPFGIFD
jgi:uncharacterized protein YcfL